jgi:hypothetical protein
MKHLKSMILGILMAMTSVPALAQSDFFFNFYGGAENFWSDIAMQIPTNIINRKICKAVGVRYDGQIDFRGKILKIKNGNEKVEIMDKSNYFGFKGKDLFNYIDYAFKFGWEPKMSPFGIYISCAYELNRFIAKWDSENWDRYKIHTLSPGIGIRITPLISMLDDYDWCPIFELGTSYNYYLGCSAPYNNDKNQFNNGMKSSFALGFRTEKNSFVVGIDLYHYSLFNKDFSIDGVNYPYKDTKVTQNNIFLTYTRDF